MGEELTLFRTEFNASLRIEARAERLTSESGAVLLREVIERLGIARWLVGRLEDTRDPDLITHPLSELLHTSLLLLGQGWQDRDDADVLRNDAVLRLAVSDRRGISPLEMRPREEGKPLSKNPPVPDGLASQPTLSRLVRMLSSEENRHVLRGALLECAARRIRATRGGHRHRYLTIDIDSLPIEVHGHQPGSAHNGYYHMRIYHPLIASIAETGDLIDAKLREGNAHTAAGSVEFLDALIEQVERKLCQVAAVRMDAGFPEEQLLASLEKRGTAYVARVRSNSVLDKLAEPYLKRPVGRPPVEPRTWTYELTYRAEKWSRARRVVLVVLERPEELFLHHFWLITNWTHEQIDGEALLDRYRQRGTAEGHMGELMDVLAPALSSAPRQKSHYRGAEPSERFAPGDSFAQNEVLLLFNVLAYGIAHATRVLMETATGEGWSLRRVRERVLRVAGRILIHGRRATLVIAESAAVLWQALWPRLAALRWE
ncbi:MAG TPA: IS1380 family transposase [Solirubrobacteraceae bacterium]|nr:IS1380 family transposase [Solirubrobacteraceae bacterium]